jgi:GNAT superfamily N-acetyltransferase
MFDLRSDCDPVILSDDQFIVDFDCGDEDLNDYFNNKALLFKEQMLAQTIFLRHNETGKVVCAFSISPNSLKTSDLPGSRRKKIREFIPREKSLQSYPAFLIGRLGVASELSGQGIGSQLMEFVKEHCIAYFCDFCRFLVIDAYNDSNVLSFYQRNGFSTVFSTEEQERSAYKIDISEPLRTRYLFFDMLQWKMRGE